MYDVCHSLFTIGINFQEHHLQRAICTGLIIPTPEVFDTDQQFYDKCYPENYKLSRQLIRMQRKYTVELCVNHHLTTKKNIH